MLLKDLEVKRSTNGVYGIDGYVVIKRGDKHYTLWVAVRSDKNVIHSGELFELFQKFILDCEKIDQNWIIGQYKESDNSKGVIIQEKEIEL